MMASTRVPRSRETASPYDPTVGLRIGPSWWSEGGVALSYERNTPVVYATEMEETRVYRGTSLIRRVLGIVLL